MKSHTFTIAIAKESIHDFSGSTRPQSAAADSALRSALMELSISDPIISRDEHGAPRFSSNPAPVDNTRVSISHSRTHGWGCAAQDSMTDA